MIGIYLRVSTDKQDEEMQRVSIHRYLSSNSIPISHSKEYLDFDISGTTTERPSYQRLLSDITNGTITKIITYEYSRMWRDLQEQNRVLKILSTLNIDLISTTEGPIKSNSPEDSLKANVLGSVNVYEVQRLRRRIQDGLKRRIDQFNKGLVPSKHRGPDKLPRKKRTDNTWKNRIKKVKT